MGVPTWAHSLIFDLLLLYWLSLKAYLVCTREYAHSAVIYRNSDTENSGAAVGHQRRQVKGTTAVHTICLEQDECCFSMYSTIMISLHHLNKSHVFCQSPIGHSLLQSFRSAQLHLFGGVNSIVLCCAEWMSHFCLPELTVVDIVTTAEVWHLVAANKKDANSYCPN